MFLMRWKLKLLIYNSEEISSEKASHVDKRPNCLKATKIWYAYPGGAWYQVWLTGWLIRSRNMSLTGSQPLKCYRIFILWERFHISTAIILVICIRDYDNSIQLFIIYVPSQQLQGRLQTQHSADIGKYIMERHIIGRRINCRTQTNKMIGIDNCESETLGLRNEIL
jgi:hypothetical protein